MPDTGLSAFEFDELGFENFQDFTQVCALFEDSRATEDLVFSVPGICPANLADRKQRGFMCAAENREGCGTGTHINGVVTPLAAGYALAVHLQKSHQLCPVESYNGLSSTVIAQIDEIAHELLNRLPVTV